RITQPPSAARPARGVERFGIGCPVAGRGGVDVDPGHGSSRAGRFLLKHRPMSVIIDPVDLTRDLIRRPSVTPADAGAMDSLERILSGLGFACRRLPFEGIENLYARRGTVGPNLCFAGHTDVVPAGAESAWTAGPFEAEVRDGVLYGRGAVDMKGGI